MTSSELLEIIGSEDLLVIVFGRYGDAGLHANGFVTVDPCYLSCGKEINQALHGRYPWQGYDYLGHKKAWSEFTFNGATAYFRDCDDGTGYFGRAVDSGRVVAIPFAALPKADQTLLQERISYEVAS